MKQEIAICWLRRDLRLIDNTALFHALKSGYKVLIVFIFDTNILDKLPSPKDARVTFIFEVLQAIDEELKKHGSSLYVAHGTPEDCFKKITSAFQVKEVHANHDYEPYAIERDAGISKMLQQQNIGFLSYKDQVIFEKSEVMKADGTPYTVYTPYSNIWKQRFAAHPPVDYPSEKLLSHLISHEPFHFPTLAEMGFDKVSSIPLQPQIDENIIRDYEKTRNIPGIEGTSRLSPYLRFGIVSTRQMVKLAQRLNGQWLNELIWREFFMMILFHFPHVLNHS
ncbi:MAG: deoxyribodipyrimidine photo-lyase, partial [Chitinophagaceae bacterium]